MSAAQLELPHLTDLKDRKRATVVLHKGKRVVICPVTDQVITKFASLPVKVGKGVKWFGTFYDYETVMAYLAEIKKRQWITDAAHESLVALLTSQLGYTPAVPNYDLNSMLVEGFAAYRGAYMSLSSMDMSKYFEISEKKEKSEKTEKPPRYNVFEANQDKTGIHSEGLPVKCTANSIPEMVKPWNEDDLEKVYTFLVSFDGNKSNAVVAESTTPMHHAKALGLPGAKGGSRVYVLKGTKAPKPVAVKQEEKKEEEATPKAPAPKKRKAVATA